MSAGPAGPRAAVLPVRVEDELDLLEALVHPARLAAARIVEAGCGAARLARELLVRHPRAEVWGLEVDARQHAKNLADPAPRLHFELAGAQAIAHAHANVGRAVPGGVVGDIVSTVSNGFTQLDVPGFAQKQQARVRALAMADGSVRPVIEANVVDVTGGSTLAYTVLVDAVSGKVLHRENKVHSVRHNRS